MKILMVIPALGSVYGGPSKTVVELAQALGNRGLQVDLVATTANGNTQLDVPTLTWISEASYRVQYFPYWKIGDYKFSLSLTRWLFDHVKDYDLVHTNAIFSYPVLPAHWACQFHQVPYIMTPHGMLEPWALAYKSRKKNLYFTLLEKPALQRACAIQMLASSEAERVKNLTFKTPLVTVPNGIHRKDIEKLPEADIFHKQFPSLQNKKLILFLGRIDPKKGLDLLATAFAQVNLQFPETHLIIAGPDNINFTPKVKSYFAQAGCLESVTFAGMLTGEVKYSALAAASIYVAPSYSEGFSMSVLEGMASGLPCVITTGCNFPEAGEANAALVVDIRADSISEALLWCLHNPREAQEMGCRARLLIFEKYTWDKIAAQMEKVYLDILKSLT
jgi:glycosyltransferase involved in cell wall biosynthesis